MQHHAPHKRAAFEGYYNKFLLPSGAQLILVICKVKQAKSNADVLSFTYVPQDPTGIWQKEFYLDALDMRRINSAGNAFVLDAPGFGHVQWDDDGLTKYDLQHELFSLQAKSTSRTPWSQASDTPEGIFVNLPLPLHWHVQTLASSCKLAMSITDYDLPKADISGEAELHQEKNWAHAFPSAHMWTQARDGERGLCCAGGKILGLQAFLLGYRSADLNFDFRPPFALGILGWSPFMSYHVDWEDRTFELSVQSFTRKIVVRTSAPKGSFFSLSPPFPEGHRENYLGQSLHAKMEVKVYESGWFGAWRLVREDLFERAALEFGAGYYPPAGSERKFN